MPVLSSIFPHLAVLDLHSSVSYFVVYSERLLIFHLLLSSHLYLCLPCACLPWAFPSFLFLFFISVISLNGAKIFNSGVIFISSFSSLLICSFYRISIFVFVSMKFEDDHRPFEAMVGDIYYKTSVNVRKTTANVRSVTLNLFCCLTVHLGK